MASKRQTAERDFEFIEENDTVKLKLRTMVTSRRLVYTLALISLLFIGIFAIGIGLIAIAEGGFFLLLIGIAAIAVLWPISRWANGRRETEVLVDAEGVHIADKLYPFEDIDSIGWRFGGGTLVSKSQTAHAVHAMAHETSGIVYLAFGNKEITIANTLRENEVETVYTKLKDAMVAKGFTFRDD